MWRAGKVKTKTPFKSGVLQGYRALNPAKIRLIPSDLLCARPHVVRTAQPQFSKAILHLMANQFSN